jgi:hypothetical protein
MADMLAVLGETYGPLRIILNIDGDWKPNEHYRTQLMSDRKRRRIYLKDESVVSFLLLKQENIS